MTETECRYEQIETTTWACEKLSDYLLGHKFSIESDHKPLIPLLNTKHLDSLPPRVLRFRLRLARFNYTVFHVPGKDLNSADTLSRAPLTQGTENNKFQTEVEEFVNAMTERSLPATTQHLDEYRKAQKEDPVCKQIVQYLQQGRPDKHSVPPAVAPYWKDRGYLSVCNRLLMYGHRIVVPAPLRCETAEKIHTGHQGIERCRARAAAAVWWPGIGSQITNTVQQFPTILGRGQRLTYLS